MVEILLITYNRGEKLRRTLKAILDSELSALKITVLDNCSTDGTDKILSNLKENKNIRFRCIRHKNNLGAVANVMRAYEVASEEYLWVLCDDDEYDFSDFKDVITILKIHHPDIVLVGSPNKTSTEQMFPGKVDKILNASDFRNTELPLILTFLPSAIIKTEKLKNCDFSLGYMLSNTYFPQFFWISKMINMDCSLYVIKKLMVLRSPVGHGLESDFVHVNGYLNVVEYLSTKKEVEHAKELYYGFGYFAYGIFIAKLLAREKISNKLNINNYIDHIARLDIPRKIICLCALVILFIPTPLLSGLKIAIFRKR